jgi:hypothetical protein
MKRENNQNGAVTNKKKNDNDNEMMCNERTRQKRDRNMKLWENVRLLTRDEIPKFEHFRVYCKEERIIFLRTTKTFGSLFRYPSLLKNP